MHSPSGMHPFGRASGFAVSCVFLVGTGVARADMPKINASRPALVCCKTHQGENSIRCFSDRRGLLVVLALSACGSNSRLRTTTSDASTTQWHGSTFVDAGNSPTNDRVIDGGVTCSRLDGGTPYDPRAFNGVCPSAGCPSGTVCTVEVGGVAGGGGEQNSGSIA